MLSPTPVSLLCALLLCLPLAIVFTILTPTTTTNGGSTAIPPLPVINSTKSGANPVTATTTYGGATKIPGLPINPIDGIGVAQVATGTSATRGGSTSIPISITTTTANKSNADSVTASSADSVTAFNDTIKDQEMIENVTNTSAPPPQPPSPAEDDDDPLLRRAARVNPKPSPPRKLAFMFLTTTPLPFAPLWELYFNQTSKRLYNIYIHADPSFPYDPPFSGEFENRIVPSSKPTQRYSPTLISAARRLLSHALLDDPSNSMFALLSPSCIPLHSFKFTYKTLVRSRKSFIEILRNEHGAYDRWAARGEDTMLPEVPFENFRIGSQFFVLTRKHARLVVSDSRLWSKFKLPCLNRYTCYPEEHYFPTLMSIKDPRGCVPATLTHVDWRGSHDGHPRTYNSSEVGPELILALRSDRPRYGDDAANGSDSSVIKRRHPFLFARKFSAVSLQPLMSVANEVILKE